MAWNNMPCSFGKSQQLSTVLHEVDRIFSYLFYRVGRWLLSRRPSSSWGTPLAPRWSYPQTESKGDSTCRREHWPCACLGSAGRFLKEKPQVQYKLMYMCRQESRTVIIHERNVFQDWPAFTVALLICIKQKNHLHFIISFLHIVLNDGWKVFVYSQGAYRALFLINTLQLSVTINNTTFLIYPELLWA